MKNIFYRRNYLFKYTKIHFHFYSINMISSLSLSSTIIIIIINNMIMMNEE